MCERQVFRLVLVTIVIVTQAIADFAVAREPRADTPGQELSSAAKDFVGTLNKMGKTLERAPAKVDVSKWESIKQGALEIKSKAAKLRETIRTVDRTGDELGLQNGQLQARLGEIRSNFDRRASEAESQADALSEPLASVVRKERQMWLRWSQVTVDFGNHYEVVLMRFEKQMAEIKHVQPILGRLEEGAEDCAKLAEIGQRLDSTIDSLEAMGSELNEVIDAFNSLSEQTAAAIAETNTSRSPGIAETVYRAHNESQYRQWQSARGTTVSARLVSIDGNSVRLQYERDGNCRDIRINQLSKSDQEHVRHQMLLRSVASN
jgi:methyl-accepting chemotaxis protein